ncbi:hypothetical protein [Rhodoplanes azumiensis]|uniref:Cysteine rich repeat-containing protein n=1 Tax=Rhodoplanes azumiensis TaxID=1897628 RepID=A0ABW5AQ39_9BRAD
MSPQPRSLSNRRSVPYGRAVRRLSAAVVLLAVSVTAGAAMGTDEERSACIPDAFRLCSSAIPDATRVIACLKTERVKLSPACRTVMKRNGTI